MKSWATPAGQLAQALEPLDLVELALEALALGDVGDHDEPTPSAAELHLVRPDLDLDHRPVLLDVPPRAGAVARSRRAMLSSSAGTSSSGRRSLIDMLEELLAGVAVVLDSRLVDLEDLERLIVVDPHRLRVVVEQVTVRLGSGGRVLLGGAQRADQAVEALGQVDHLSRRAGRHRVRATTAASDRGAQLRDGPRDLALDERGGAQHRRAARPG